MFFYAVRKLSILQNGREVALQTIKLTYHCIDYSACHSLLTG